MADGLRRRDLLLGTAAAAIAPSAVGLAPAAVDSTDMWEIVFVGFAEPGREPRGAVVGDLWHCMPRDIAEPSSFFRWDGAAWRPAG